MFNWRTSKESTMNKSCRRYSRRGILRLPNRTNLILIIFFVILSAILSTIEAHPIDEEEDYRPNFAIVHGAPLITPVDEEVILELNINYSIECESKEPIFWVKPCSICDYEESYVTPNITGGYGLKLTLINVTYHYVGAYYCVKNSTIGDKDPELINFVELMNTDDAATTYIYVNDPVNRLVSNNLAVLNAYQYSDLIIPCKPTQPSCEVLLTDPDGNTHSSETAARYDPRQGFNIQIHGLMQAGAYHCRPQLASSANEEEEKAYYIKLVGNEHNDLGSTKKSNKFREFDYRHPATGYSANPTKTTHFTTTISSTARSILTGYNKTTTTTIPNKRYGKATVTNLVYPTNSTFKLTYPSAGDFVVSNYKKLLKKIIQDNSTNGEGYNYGDGKKYIGNSIKKSILNQIDLQTSSSDSGENNVKKHMKIYEHGNSIDSDESTGESISSETKYSSFRWLNKRVPRTTNSPRSYYANYRSTPRTSSKHINKPTIKSPSHGHVYEGESFELFCEVQVDFDINFSANWVTPEIIPKSRLQTPPSTFKNKTDTHNLGVAVLTVTDAKTTDSGMYKCNVIDHNNNEAHTTFVMTVLKKNESYINMTEPLNHYEIVVKANNEIMMNVRYRGFPWPKITWHSADGTKITPTSKFEIITTDKDSTLRIANAQMTDSGVYTVTATNDIISKKQQFSVTIRDVPRPSVADVHVRVGEEAHVVCTVLSMPTAVVTWLFTPCSTKPRWPSCDQTLQQNFNSSRNSRPGSISIESFHDLYFTPTSPGIIHCIAGNTMGNKMAHGHILMGDIDSNMTIYGIDENRKIARGDEITITCAVLAYYFTDQLDWYKNGKLVEPTNDIEITTSPSDYSYKKILKFKSISDRDADKYECRAKKIISNNILDGMFIYLIVHEPKAPIIEHSNMDYTEWDREIGSSLELVCQADGIPKPEIEWYKDDTELHTNEFLTISDDKIKLNIQFLKPDDEGTYKCLATNRLGVVDTWAEVRIINKDGLTLGWILCIVFSIAFLICVVIYLLVRVNQERKLLQELKAAGLANFEEGAVEQINPALTLDEQADLLPYDRAFEFPRDKLKLGKQLGAGAFGVVLKADAEGIRSDERETVVAVKMVKRTADNEVMKALVSELKIMVHLGQHLNVVNLLGAVTKNIGKRELMVIVEYCRFGNVQNVLLRNRKRFIDQINPDTGRIDPTISTQRFSDNFELNRNSDNDPRSGTRSGRPNSRGYIRQSELYEGQMDSCATEQTVMTTIPEDEDHILSNNSIQPAWRSNYKPDSTEAMTITTSDLVSWAFQVARGMDYLASRKVLHGDLAARNILLCEENVVKICDFGLAKSMYKNDNYKKQGEARLPIKWLALESLSDHVFSTYTDVWSFGIVLWELFSLAKVPYPGIDPNQSLYLKLKDGYRMEKPPFANDDLYDIMLECWSANPESRPLFHVLEQKFARLLGEEVTNHYMDLNDPYLRTNTEFLKRNQTDYLALMGAPDEMAPPLPRYVNGHILPEIRIEPSSSDDYLQMSTETGTAIFSPTRPKDFDNSSTSTINSDRPTKNTTTTTSFTFPDQHSPTLVNNLDSPGSKHRQEKGLIQPEEMPMLHNAHSSGSDGENNSPDELKKFNMKHSRTIPTPSPRHHIETQLNGPSKDYVNIKQIQKKSTNNNNGRPADAFSNPSYHMLKTAQQTDDD